MDRGEYGRRPWNRDRERREAAWGQEYNRMAQAPSGPEIGRRHSLMAVPRPQQSMRGICELGFSPMQGREGEEKAGGVLLKAQ